MAEGRTYDWFVRRLRDDHYERAQCGALWEIPDEKVARVTIHGASGKRNERVITVDGVEVHRCTRPENGAKIPAPFRRPAPVTLRGYSARRRVTVSRTPCRLLDPANANQPPERRLTSNLVERTTGRGPATPTLARCQEDLSESKEDDETES